MFIEPHHHHRRHHSSSCPFAHYVVSKLFTKEQADHSNKKLPALHRHRLLLLLKLMQPSPSMAMKVGSGIDPNTCDEPHSGGARKIFALRSP